MSGWEAARNVLAVRLDGLGDVLMTAPAIRALREGLPGRKITLLASGAGAGAGALLRDVDSVIPYSAPWMKTPFASSSAEGLGMVERLRAARFDGAVIFTTHTQSPLPAATICYLAGIPLRLAHCREQPYHLLTNHASEPEPGLPIFHEVERQLRLVRTVLEGEGEQGGMLLKPGLLSVPHRARASAAGALAHAGVDPERPWVAVHPGASAPSRRYPPASFAAVVRGLVRETGWQVVLTGSGNERPLAEEIRAIARVKAAVLAGALSLSALAALLERAPLLIANNTGPVHLACALGTPVVDLYALTNPQHTPWGVPNRVLSHDVPCRNCYRSVCPEGHGRCLEAIPPAAVVEAARDLAVECDVFDREAPLQAAC